MPDGLSASEWAARQKNEKQAKVQNKAKYPKGAPQVPARRLGSFFFCEVASIPARRRGDGVVVPYPHAVAATPPIRRPSTRRA